MTSCSADDVAITIMKKQIFIVSVSGTGRDRNIFITTVSDTG